MSDLENFLHNSFLILGSLSGVVLLFAIVFDNWESTRKTVKVKKEPTVSAEKRKIQELEQVLVKTKEDLKKVQRENLLKELKKVEPKYKKYGTLIEYDFLTIQGS